MKKNWIHVKSGSPYSVMFCAKMQPDGAPVVVYARSDISPAQIWVRPLDEFECRFVAIGDEDA